MHRYKIEIEYDGTEFCGWQIQRQGSSIQGELEDAIFSFSGQRASVTGSGRTDAGVHAYGQVAHFDLNKEFADHKIIGAINFYVKPRRISVLSCDKVAESFHARFSAINRKYVYKIINRESPLAIEASRAWKLAKNLDICSMRIAAKLLLGSHDFTSFRASSCQALSPFKTVDYINITKDGELILIEISAKSFLHHMVRNIVGTLVQIGFGKMNPEYISEILSAKDRSKAGPTAPAHGLYFLKAQYDT